jgi:rSAM/selenodomain-associated transferase 1
VALAFLIDTLSRLSSLSIRRLVVFAPVCAEQDFVTLTGKHSDLTPQAEGDLGQRLASFISSQLALGASRVVVVGTDSPSLPVEFIERSFVALDDADVVLGPATDGGYYLIGCRDCLPPVFEGIRWSGEAVLADTIARLSDPRWRLALLPPWYDVDTPADWAMLRGHVAALRRAGIDPGIPRTESLLQRRQP